MLQVSGEYSDPVVAAHIADAALVQIGHSVTRIENGNIRVTAVGPAAVPGDTSAAERHHLGFVGAVAGFVLGLFIAVGLEVRRHGGWRPTRCGPSPMSTRLRRSPVVLQLSSLVPRLASVAPNELSDLSGRLERASFQVHNQGLKARNPSSDGDRARHSKRLLAIRRSAAWLCSARPLACR